MNRQQATQSFLSHEATLIELGNENEAYDMLASIFYYEVETFASQLSHEKDTELYFVAIIGEMERIAKRIVKECDDEDEADFMGWNRMGDADPRPY